MPGSPAGCCKPKMKRKYKLTHTEELEKRIQAYINVAYSLKNFDSKSKEVLANVI